jgi:hypothetical protein
MDIDAGTSEDCHGDGVPDDCQALSNDGCGTAQTIAAGKTVFTTCQAGSDGPDEAACTIQADAWFRHLAQCDGVLTVAVEADFDAVVAAYGVSCPSEPGTVIECGSGGVSFAVSAGSLYRLRVGSADGVVGDGTITVSCEP